MPDPFISPEVRAVLDLHPYLSDPGYRLMPIRDQIAQQAETLYRAFHRGDARVAMQVLSWWPGARGLRGATVLAGPFAPDDAHETIRREYGFASADDLETLGTATLDPVFETALDLMLAGDITGLAARLDAAPRLPSQRSRFGHGATLLHYLAANGVESHRQIVPPNAPDLARLLVARGADLAATAEIYGGGQTAHALAVTSAHPARAGIAARLCAVLAP